MAAFATPQDVRDMTTFDELKKLEDDSLQHLIDRADIFLRAYTQCDYSNVTDPEKLKQLKLVLVMLVEWIWLQNQPDIKQGNLTGTGTVQSEHIGNYSYTSSKTTSGNGKAGPTGNPELDMLLQAMSCVDHDPDEPPSGRFIGFFATSGKGRRKNDCSCWD